MYCKNFWFYPKKVSWEFQKIPRFAENRAFCMGTWIVLDCARLCQNLTNGPNILKVSENTAANDFECFSWYISLMYLLKSRSYEAFNADHLDKTSRQKLQIEKVIIPIF